MEALNQNIAYEIEVSQKSNIIYLDERRKTLRKKASAVTVVFKVLFIFCRILGTAAWTACLFAGGFIALFAIAVGIIFLLVTSIF